MADDTVLVDEVAEFRLLSPIQDPTCLVIRVKTRSGREHNFGISRDAMIHTIEHWLFDLKAAAAGHPVTGEGSGSA